MAEVISLYSPTLPQGELVWNQSRLDRFSQLADLRTRITIQPGSDQPENSVSVMGDTLALQKIGSWNIFNQNGQSKDNSAGYGFSDLSGEGKVILNDQVLSRQVLDAHEGKFEGHQFARLVDRLTRLQLIQVLREEKALQTSNSAIRMGGILIPGASVLGSMYMIYDGATNMEISLLDMRALEIFLGVLGVKVSVLIGLFFQENIPEVLKESNPDYFNSTPDHVWPLKHIFRYNLSRLYLLSGGDNFLVKFQPY